MRCSAFIAACAIFLSCEAAPRFGEPVWREEAGISFPGLVGGTGVLPLPPRAEAYLVSGEKGRRLEDRFDSLDLWTAHVSCGRWRDGEGNELYLARFRAEPPVDVSGATLTRCAFRASLAAGNVKDVSFRDGCAELVSPVELELPARRPRRAQRRNLLELFRYKTTNDLEIACVFRPKSPERNEKPEWYFASLICAPGVDVGEAEVRFDEDFLDRVEIPAARMRPRKAVPAHGGAYDEVALWREDVRAAVINYDEWKVADADDVTVVDNLDAGIRRSFVQTLTNSLPVMRRAYAERFPSPLSATNRLAVVRVFRSREEYLDYAGADKAWTAAYWCPERRELVLYHPETGTDALLSTVWHEAFHQYLAYAGSMIDASPWINEGYAQLFENSRINGRGQLEFFEDVPTAAFIRNHAAELESTMRSILFLGYDRFYDGNADEVKVRYMVAWSIAYFLEKGAPKLRFQPYADLCADYLKALVDTRDMHGATLRALGDEKSRDDFVAAWLAYWRGL